jgi:hypothetical protein
MKHQGVFYLRTIAFLLAIIIGILLRLVME